MDIRGPTLQAAFADINIRKDGLYVIGSAFASLFSSGAKISEGVRDSFWFQGRPT